MQTNNIDEIHGLMVPPAGYKFIPRTDRVCGKPGCFECYDIYCQRCESKDRRILELEMRNNEMAKYITHLSGLLFPNGEGAARGGDTSGSAGVLSRDLPAAFTKSGNSGRGLNPSAAK